MTEPTGAEPPRGRGVALVRTALAIVALALAVVFAVLYRIDNSREDHSYNSGATPPTSVRITAGHQYEISTPGGVAAVTAHGGTLAALNCSYTPLIGSSTRQLDTTGLGGGSRTTHAVATFIAPVTGSVRIECRELTKTFVDDADGVSADPGGLFLVLSTVALSVGAWLGLSALYRRRVERTARGGDPGPTGQPGDPQHPDDPDRAGPNRSTGAVDGGFGQLLAAPTDG